jgi:hypothetical protein
VLERGGLAAPRLWRSSRPPRRARARPSAFHTLEVDRGDTPRRRRGVNTAKAARLKPGHLNLSYHEAGYPFSAVCAEVLQGACAHMVDAWPVDFFVESVEKQGCVLIVWLLVAVLVGWAWWTRERGVPGTFAVGLRLRSLAVSVSVNCRGRLNLVFGARWRSGRWGVVYSFAVRRPFLLRLRLGP